MGAEFLHCKERKFYDFAHVRKEIEDETDRMTGNNKGISSVPINLRVYSPNVLNLTLVDLPGLTKVAVGDQPKDIEQQIKGMIAEFISRENCLILAVTPANTDLANSDALKLAKEYDPQGNRTIGVITKLDLMDEGTDAKHILENKFLPLKRGYVGVVNRSQKDISGGKDIGAALASETQYFQQHPAYCHMVDRMGTSHLQKVLNQQLTNHIKNTLPQLKKKLQDKLRDLEKEVEPIKHLAGTSSRDVKFKQMIGMVQGLVGEFSRIVEGTGAGMKNVELSGGARINILFHSGLHYEMAKHKVDEAQLRKEIKMCIQNVRAIRSGLFTPDQAFEEVVRSQIVKLKEPAMWCVERVGDELAKIMSQCTEHMRLYPMLRDEVDRVLTEQIKEQEVRTKEQIQTLIATEMAYIDTHHPDFIGFANSTARTTQKGPSGPTAEKIKILRSGWLSLHLGGLLSAAKEFWFVLETDALTWYKDELEDEKRYSIKMEDIMLREVEKSGFLSSKPAFVLFSRSNRNLHKDHRSIELSAETQEDLEKWKMALHRAGVQPVGGEHEEEAGGMDESEVIVFDPTLGQRVETIRNMVDSYMGIIKCNIKDLIPKVVMALMVNEVKTFIMNEIQTIFLQQDVESLMEESPEEVEKRETLLGMYSSLKDSLKVLQTFNLNKPDSLPSVTVDSSNTSSYTSRPRSTYGSSNVTNDYNGNGGGGGGYSYPSSPVKTLPSSPN